MLMNSIFRTLSRSRICLSSIAAISSHLHSSSGVSSKAVLKGNENMDADRSFKGWSNEAGFGASAEQREPKEIPVKGFIPAAVAGTLWRTGPGDYQIKDTPSGDFTCSHWFDGFTTVYRFEIIPNEDGSCRVVYTSRKQVDALIEHVRKTGRLDGVSFGQKRDPCESVFRKLKAVFISEPKLGPQGSNDGVTIAPNVPGFPSAPKAKGSIEGKDPRIRNLVTFTDANSMKTMDPKTLEPIGVTDQRSLHPDLSGPLAASHAHFDPATGDVYNFNLAFGATATYRVFRVLAATGKTEILATIRGSNIKPAYIHSFFLSSDFVILGIWSSHLTAGGVSILWEKNILNAIGKFNPESKTQWLVVDRKHGRGVVARFASPAMFAFHTVNAWQEERDGKIDIYGDIVQYADIDILHRLYYDNLVSTSDGVSKYAGGANKGVNPSLVRYRFAGIPLDTTAPNMTISAKAEKLFQIDGPAVGELPTINPNFSTKKSRFVYSICDRGLSSWVDSLVKTDLETKEVIYWEHQHHTPGEALFIPDPNGETEDSGYLLSVILDGDNDSSYLLCLDARTMKELGRAECSDAVGMGFHGRHLSQL